MSKPTFLTFEEVAKELGYKKSTVVNWFKPCKGKNPPDLFPHPVKINRSVRFTYESIISFKDNVIKIAQAKNVFSNELNTIKNTSEINKIAYQPRKRGRPRKIM